MNKVLVFFLLFFAFLFESSSTQIPLVFLVMFVLYVLYRKIWMVGVAFGFGIVLDLLLLRWVGQTSLVYIFFLVMIFLYERKFEIMSPFFVGIAAFLGSIFYCFVFGSTHIFLLAAASSFFAVVCLFLFSFVAQPLPKNSLTYE